jgi:hypothetical protein
VCVEAVSGPLAFHHTITSSASGALTSGIHGNTGGTTKHCSDTEAAARQRISEAFIDGVAVTSTTCAPEK